MHITNGFEIKMPTPFFKKEILNLILMYCKSLNKSLSKGNEGRNLKTLPDLIYC